MSAVKGEKAAILHWSCIRPSGLPDRSRSCACPFATGNRDHNLRSLIWKVFKEIAATSGW